MQRKAHQENNINFKKIALRLEKYKFKWKFIFQAALCNKRKKMQNYGIFVIPSLKLK